MVAPVWAPRVSFWGGAVADRIVVLRLGRNAAEFRTEDVSTEELVAAITGASDNVVTARAQRTGAPQTQPEVGHE